MKRCGRSLAYLALAIVVSGVDIWAEPVKSKTLHRIERHLLEYTLTNIRAEPIEIGTAVERKLGYQGLRSPKDGTPLDLFTFRGVKGGIVAVTVESDEFDPIIWLMHPDEYVLLQGDDDSGNGTDARFAAVLPRQGGYLLAVNSHGKRGSYLARVVKQPSLRIGRGGSKKRAVLIGINDYPGTYNDLSAPVHDTDAVREVLESRAGFEPSDILVLKDAHATRENILKSIRVFLSSIPPDGVVLVYFSGHGVQLATQTEHEVDKRDEALFLADGSYLRDHELRDLVDCIGARAVTVIVDACYSGGIHRGSGQKNVSEKSVKKFLELADVDRRLEAKCDPSRVVEREVNLIISASQEDEKAWEWNDWRNLSNPRSVFTYFLVEALHEALSGTVRVSVESMSIKISEKTTAFTEANRSATQEVRLLNYSGRHPFVRAIVGLPENHSTSE